MVKDGEVLLSGLSADSPYREARIVVLGELKLPATLARLRDPATALDEAELLYRKWTPGLRPIVLLPDGRRVRATFKRG